MAEPRAVFRGVRRERIWIDGIVVAGYFRQALAAITWDAAF